MLTRSAWFAVALTLVLGVAPAARAQFAVIDVASLSQLISEVQVLEQQLATARAGNRLVFRLSLSKLAAGCGELLLEHLNLGDELRQ